MKTFRKISAVLLVIGIVVATFFACNKEKVESINEHAAGTHIATLSKASGEITYSYNLKELQQVLNEKLPTKDANRYILESAEIIESMQVEDTVFSGLQFVILDSETESSITIWASDGFLNRINFPDSICYYFPQNIVDGNYSYKNYGNNEATMVTVRNHEIESITPSDYSSGPIFCVSCHNIKCTKGCNIRPTWTGWTCSECKGSDPDRRCETVIDYSHLLDFIIAAAAVAAAFL